MTEPGYLEGIERVAFVCGCGHSGTTLLARILGAHPDVYVHPNETNAFLKGAAVMQARLGDLRREAVESGRSYLVEKTPRHIRKLKRIRATLPGAKFVIIVRDGRDVVTSLAKRSGGDFAGALARWMADNRIAYRSRRRSDVHVLRYEDIVTDTETTIRTLCGFLGIPYDEQMLRYYEQPTNWFGRDQVREEFGPGKEHGDRRNWQVNQPIFDGRGRWKEGLPAEYVERFRSGAPAEMMDNFGYDTPLLFRLQRLFKRISRRLIRPAA